MLQGSSYAFHGVDINPCDARLLVTANQEEGVSLLDFRKPNQPIMKYGTKGKDHFILKLRREGTYFSLSPVQLKSTRLMTQRPCAFDRL